MKFLADGMLGKLTRWLRMLGYDTRYSNDVDDDQLLEIALDEKRILLTRDNQLFRKASIRGIKAFLVDGRTEAEKLTELAGRFRIRLDIDVRNSRCPKCNGEIKPVPKEKIEDRIPESTSRFYDEFWVCRKCGQIYWQGSHWKRISRTLSRAKRMAKQLMNET